MYRFMEDTPKTAVKTAIRMVEALREGTAPTMSDTPTNVINAVQSRLQWFSTATNNSTALRGKNAATYLAESASKKKDAVPADFTEARKFSFCIAESLKKKLEKAFEESRARARASAAGPSLQDVSTPVSKSALKRKASSNHIQSAEKLARKDAAEVDATMAMMTRRRKV